MRTLIKAKNVNRTYVEHGRKMLPTTNLWPCCKLTKYVPKIKLALEDASVHELVDMLPELSPQQQSLLFRHIDSESAYQCFENLELNLREELLDLLPNRQLQLIVNDMSPDKRTALLEELPNDYINRLLTLLTPKERVVALSLLGYPENSIGRLMTPDYIAIHPDWTVQQVLNTHSRKWGG